MVGELKDFLAAPEAERGEMLPAFCARMAERVGEVEALLPWSDWIFMRDRA